MATSPANYRGRIDFRNGGLGSRNPLARTCRRLVSPLRSRKTRATAVASASPTTARGVANTQAFRIKKSSPSLNRRCSEFRPKKKAAPRGRAASILSPCFSLALRRNLAWHDDRVGLSLLLRSLARRAIACLIFAPTWPESNTAIGVTLKEKAGKDVDQLTRLTDFAFNR